MKKVTLPSLFFLLILSLINLSARNSFELGKQNIDHNKIEQTDFQDSAFTKTVNFFGMTFDSEMNFKNVIFKDSVDFYNSTFNAPADFSYCLFDSAQSSVDAKKADFNSVQFLSDANFFDCKFYSTVDFQNSKFNAHTDFSKSDFRQTDFMGAHFLSGVEFIDCNFYLSDFTQVKFDSVADFSQSNFHDSISFSEANFNFSVDFSSVIFDTIAVFKKANFVGETYFTGSVLPNRIDFSDANFNSSGDFSKVTFDSLAVFKNADFRGETEFTGAVLPNRLDFSYVNHISDEIDLTRATINEKYDLCYINLVGADIGSIKFRYNRFKLWFPPEGSIDFELKSNVYEDLLKKQKDEGFTQSYEKLDREYKEFKYTGKKGNYLELFWGELQNWVDKNWWGYGYNKELIILNSLILYLLFSFMNTFMLKHLTIRVYEAEKINEYWKETEGSKLTMIFRSVPFSLFYTAQIFFGFKFDVDKLRYKENLQGFKIFNLIYFLTVYLSGLVCFAYLANYVLNV